MNSLTFTSVCIADARAVVTIVDEPGRLYRARCRWPSEAAVSGDPAPTIQAALESLEEKLIDDCAAEMCATGAA